MPFEQHPEEVQKDPEEETMVCENVTGASRKKRSLVELEWSEELKSSTQG